MKDLEKEIADLKEEVSERDETITELRDEIKDNKEEISRLEDEVSELETSVRELQEEVTSYEEGEFYNGELKGIDVIKFTSSGNILDEQLMESFADLLDRFTVVELIEKFDNMRKPKMGIAI